jgi:hypothetical protein
MQFQLSSFVKHGVVDTALTLFFYTFLSPFSPISILVMDLTIDFNLFGDNKDFDHFHFKHGGFQVYLMA